MVWRRLVMPGDFSVAEFHNMIQLSFGWDDDHLHLFHIHGKDYVSAKSTTLCLPVGCELVIKLLLGADTNHGSVFSNDNRPDARSFDP